MTSGLVVLLAAVALGAPAAAQPRSEAERISLERQLAELKRQAQDLQEQIRRIEAQLARAHSPVAAASRPITTVKQPNAGDCSLPFYLDSSGLKRVRPECLETSIEVSCEAPFMLDENGIRRVRPDCGSATSALGRPNKE